jgi:DNA-binding transcriptional MocR family regulator
MPSYIMKLVEVAERPGMISFATGLPDNSYFDTAALKESAGKARLPPCNTGRPPATARSERR